MGFKKEAKKRFNLIENIFIKNVTKRIEDLEDQTKDLQNNLNEYENEMLNFSSLSNEISDIRNKLKCLASKQKPDEEQKNIICVDDLKMLLRQQRDYIDSRIKKIEKDQLTSNTVNELINDRCKELLKEIDGNNHFGAKSFSPSIEIEYSKIRQQITTTASQIDEYNKRIEQISNSLLEEREKNRKYEQILTSLFKRVEALEKKETQNTLNTLHVSNNYRSLDEVCEKKLPETNVTTSIDHIPIFTDNNICNTRNLDKIIANASILQEQYESILPNDDDNSVYFKTVDSLIVKLNKIRKKCSDTELEASDLSNELAKALNATILKNFAKQNLREVIDSFFLECGIEKKVLLVGEKLNDEAFDFIGDAPLIAPVKIKEQHNTIIDKTHDAYVIYYTDEEELTHRVLPGQYTIGKYLK